MPLFARHEEHCNADHIKQQRVRRNLARRVSGDVDRRESATQAEPVRPIVIGPKSVREGASLSDGCRQRPIRGGL